MSARPLPDHASGPREAAMPDSAILAEHPNDVCACGDYRHQHRDGKFECLLRDLCTPSRCGKFRMFRAYSPSRRET